MQAIRGDSVGYRFFGRKNTNYAGWGGLYDMLRRVRDAPGGVTTHKTFTTFAMHKVHIHAI